jgi:predicted membrane protein
MQGRYGSDSLNNFLLGIYFILFLINLFVPTLIVSLLETILIILMFFRMLSRNVYKRRAENEKFRRIASKLKSFFALQKSKFRDRKTHVYKACPACKSLLRLPKQKGEHIAVCPRCERRFDVKIR